ncbi:MAG TPA: hypothetical protein VIK55_05945 [Paludibacter sp.]
MHLKILQKKFSPFRSSYQILENDQIIGTAKSVFFSFHKRIRYCDNNDNEIFQLKKFILTIHQKYGITFANGNYLQMNGKSWIYDFYEINLPYGMIEVHHQRGVKVAIFRNEEQVAEIKKNRMIFLDGDEYEILANSDFNKDLLVAICLAWDMGDSANKDDSIVSFDIGKIGPMKRKGAENWIPKNY